MRRVSVRAMALLLSICFSAGAMAESGGRPPEVRRFDLETTASLGRQIYEQDRYAAKATDIVLERLGGPDALKKEGAGDWIVEQDGRGATVRFIKSDNATLTPVYEVRFDGSKNGAFLATPGAKLSPKEIARFKARQLALASIPEPCSPRYHAVVLPDPEGPGLLVYALATTDNPEKIPLTGHYRFTVAGTGEKIEKVDRLFSTCAMLDKPNLKEGKGPAVCFVAHPVSDTPAETHVFLSLLEGVPFYVTTRNKEVWRVAGGSINKLINLKNK